MTHRRAILLMLPAVALGGCPAPQTVTVQNTKQAAADAAAIPAALKRLMPTIEALPEIDEFGMIETYRATTIGVLVDELAGVAAEIEHAPGERLAPLVDRLWAGLLTIAMLLAPVQGLPVSVIKVLGAALSVLRTIELSLGLPTTPHSGIPLQFRAGIEMAPAEARNVLAAAGK